MSKAKRAAEESSVRGSKSPPSLAPKALDEETVSASGVKAEFDAFIVEARHVGGANPPTFRGDAALAYHNVSAGLAAVLTQRYAIEASGLRVDWHALEEMPRVALALVYACEQVEGESGANEELQRQLVRGRVLRDIAATSLRALLASGVVKARDAEKLKGGGGPLNLALDLVKFAEFFARRQDEVRGLTPFRGALVREAEKLGAELLKVVKPKGSPKVKNTELTAARHDRDCLAALLVQRQELLERVAGGVWGRGLEEHVPMLQSRVREKKKPSAKKSKPAPPEETVGADDETG